MHLRLIAALGLALATGVTAAPPTLSIAAAANLTYVVSALKEEFARSAPGVHVNVALGASGNLYAQIAQGAPYDVFLSADTEYPRQLVANGAAVPDTLYTFATGRLAVWTTRPALDLHDPAAALRSSAVVRIAIAQPKTAPYGRAAVSALHRLGVWDACQPKLAMGENIAQTAQFVETGNADCGFVALSFLAAGPLRGAGRWVEIAPELYGDAPLDHAVVVTQHGRQNAGARDFLAFLRSPAAKRILEADGYRVP